MLESAPLDSMTRNAQPAWVICLCADWCGTCRDYDKVFAAIAARFPALRFAWLDIEDQADLVGDLDVETFPTLIVANEQGTQFLGPLTPHAETLSRLLESLTQTAAATVPHLPESKRLLLTLESAPEYWVSPAA